jgi:hypothetical protein
MHLSGRPGSERIAMMIPKAGIYQRPERGFVCYTLHAAR